MFLRTESRSEKAYGSRWHQGIGDVPCLIGFVSRTFDVFQCDTCRREIPCLRIDGSDKPAEPFYCGQCNNLVSV